MLTKTVKSFKKKLCILKKSNTQFYRYAHIDLQEKNYFFLGSVINIFFFFNFIKKDFRQKKDVQKIFWGLK